ncbi:hypothetical protein ANCCEY_02463 [Ancylostoma ceylanicum]|uniref:Uncharacterized protein n=1 Tax=Ancylostoma ceylanicum TaxID=53326 RepID=A0A0D6M4T9_9BILA|nr:hypothetical protein ANCCEY_02463 [Ancylostoma ceylanicum]
MAKVADITTNGDNKSDIARSSELPLFFILLCTICMSVLYSNILTYHITITQLHSYGNGSITDYYDDFGFREINDTRVNITIHKHKFLSNPQKEALIAVCPLGGLISWFPVAYAYNQMGFRRCFVLCAVLAIVPSVFIPICTSARTFLLACVVRILQGEERVKWFGSPIIIPVLGFSLAAFLPYLCKMALFIPMNNIVTPTIIFAYIQVWMISCFHSLNKEYTLHLFRSQHFSAFRYFPYSHGAISVGTPYIMPAALLQPLFLGFSCSSTMTMSSRTKRQEKACSM